MSQHVFGSTPHRRQLVNWRHATTQLLQQHNIPVPDHTDEGNQLWRVLFRNCIVRTQVCTWPTLVLHRRNMLYPSPLDIRYIEQPQPHMGAHCHSPTPCPTVGCKHAPCISHPGRVGRPACTLHSGCIDLATATSEHYTAPTTIFPYPHPTTTKTPSPPRPCPHHHPHAPPCFRPAGCFPTCRCMHRRQQCRVVYPPYTARGCINPRGCMDYTSGGVGAAGCARGEYTQTHGCVG